MKEKKQRINIKRQIDNNKKAGKITTEKQERNTTQKQVCLLTILASSLLCALFTLFHSHPPPRFPVPLVSTGSGKRASSWRFYSRVPFRERMRGGESERGRKTIILEEGPLTF